MKYKVVTFTTSESFDSLAEAQAAFDALVSAGKSVTIGATDDSIEPIIHMEW